MNIKDIKKLVEKLNYAQKVERSLDIINDSYKKYGNYMVVANSLGKDSSVVWNLAKRVDKNIRGFIVTTRFKPTETIKFMYEEVAKYPELKIFKNDVEMDGPQLYLSDPDTCCQLLKIEPTKEAIKKMNISCWVTGLRCTEGRTRTDFQEIEERDEGLIKLNPILIWYEREVWQYLALNRIEVNPLYSLGYRSLGCAPCSNISSADSDERAGRWQGTSKCGGECGIHTKMLKK